MRTSLRFVAVWGVLIALSLACGLGGGEPTGTPPVVQLMPDLPGYDVIEGREVQDYIAGLAQGAALLAGNPQMLLMIEKVDQMVACYQEAGALNITAFTDQNAPLSSGAIAIVDRNRLQDPATLFRCAADRIVPFAEELTVKPCAHSYTLERDDNAFHIAYVGTTPAICEAFCNHLEGCSSN
jgi:hypothetical protein